MGKFIKTRYLVPFLILVGGFVVMTGLIVSRKPPARERREYYGVLVRIIEAAQTDRQVTITGTGTVRPRYEFNLTPQIAGIVEWVHHGLEAGGSFSKGDTLLRIEAKEYLLSVQQAEASVAQAQYQFDLEKANAAIALEEWDLMNSSTEASNSTSEQVQPDPLVLREPQLRQAEAGLKSARASLDLARLNLERTVLRAPYNCRVRNISVSPGQLISVSTPVASLYSTDIVEIDVGLQMADIVWIQIPGAPARITLDTGGEVLEWKGHVDRTVGVLDEIGRLAQVIIQVDDPFGHQSPDQPDLNIGSFVQVEISGRSLKGTIALPRSAIRENSTVWIANEDNLLDIREVSIERLTTSEALIGKGISPGEKVVTTFLAGASEGMKLRPVLEEVP